MRKNQDSSHHVYALLLYRLCIMFVLLVLSRWSLYWLNTNMFGTLSSSQLWHAFWHGMRFDMFVLSILAVPPLLYYTLLAPLMGAGRYIERLANTISLLGLFVAMMLNASDAIYYRFTLKRLSFDIFPYLLEHGGGLEFLPMFIIDFWYITLPSLIIIILFSKLFLCKWRQRKARLSTPRPIASIVLFLISGTLLIVAMRGGLQLKPIRIVDASRGTTPVAVPLVLNTPFSIVKTYGQKGLQETSFFEPQALAHYYNPLHAYPADSSTAQPSKKNVVIIILESFSLEHIGYFTGNMSFTPFLDSLFAHSLSRAAFANGKRSIEGIPAVLSGLPTLSTASFLNSAYAANRIQSIASYLKPYGYHSAFFHGGKNGTMSFDAYAAKVGFDDYYGMNEYPSPQDYDGQWGIWDEPYLQYMAQQLNKLPTPFVVSVFTLSSHHPYQVPQAYDKQLPHGSLPIQHAIAYTDLALQHFFATAKKQPWYKNTLFVITADHTSEGSAARYSNAYGQFRIPLALFAPADSSLQQRPTATCLQQTDIFPSIADYLGCPDSLLSFGNSIFDTAAARLVANRYGHYLQFMNDKYLTQWQNDSVTACYNYKKDPLLQRPIPLKLQDTLLLNRCKAYMQQYNNRMIQNRLTP